MQTLRLNPNYPLLWRDPHTVQFGVDALATLDSSEPWVERLLHSLRTGIRRLSFDVVAHGCGAPRDEARALLAVLAPVLAEYSPELPAVWIEPSDDLPSRVALRLAEALEDEGVRVVAGAAPPSADASDCITLVVCAGVATATRSAAHLRDDRAHLVVAFDGGGVTTGPLVLPGETPCLSCRDEHDRDRDSAWALVHTQLMAHRPGTVPLRRIAEAANNIRQLLTGIAEQRKEASGRSIRVSGDGHHESRSVRFHEECRCRSLQESVPVPAPLVLPIATRSPQEFARLA